MGFDLSKLVSDAQEFTENQQSGNNSGSRIRVVYPGTGVLKVKLLYNPKSNLVARQIRRHKIENTNYNCLATYGMECPICKAVDNIKNATNLDLWKFNSKTRGISYAQYVGSDRYGWNETNKEPQVGELILLMYPWSVYQDINRLISSAGVQADKLIASNSGKVLNITRYRENSQERYKCEVDAFAPEFKSFNTDEEFENFLMNLPDLNESIMPSIASPDMINKCTEVANTLQRDYLKNTNFGGIPTTEGNQMSGSTPVVEIGGVNYVLVDGKYVPITTTVPSSVPTTPNYSTTGTPPAIPQYANISGGLTQVGSDQSLPWDHATTTVTSKNTLSTPTTAPTTPSATPTVGGNTMPDCFGHHEDGSPKCLACIHEVPCMVMNQ